MPFDTRRALRGGPVLGAFCGALTLAACGGSGQASHSAFVAKANSYCHSTNMSVTELSEPTSLSSLATYADETRTQTVKLQRQLSALEVPSSDKNGFRRYLAALERGNRLLSRISSAAAADETSAVGSLGKELAGVPTAPLATELGLTQCAKSTNSASA